MPKSQTRQYFVPYLASKKLAALDAPFYGLIMAAMRKADTDNLIMLRTCWPDVWTELKARYNAPGGALTEGERAVLMAANGG